MARRAAGRGAEAVSVQNEHYDDSSGIVGLKKAITVSIPLPDPLLTINWRRRHHWRQQAKHSREQRETAALCAYEALSRECGTLRGIYFPEGRVTVDVTIYRRPRQQQTDDSAVVEFCKPLWDGCEDAGIVRDDKQCRIGAITWHPSNAAPRVELTLRQEGI